MTAQDVNAESQPGALGTRESDTAQSSVAAEPSSPTDDAVPLVAALHGVLLLVLTAGAVLAAVIGPEGDGAAARALAGGAALVGLFWWGLARGMRWVVRLELVVIVVMAVIMTLAALDDPEMQHIGRLPLLWGFTILMFYGLANARLGEERQDRTSLLSSLGEAGVLALLYLVFAGVTVGTALLLFEWDWIPDDNTLLMMGVLLLPLIAGLVATCGFACALGVRTNADGDGQAESNPSSVSGP